MNQDRVDDAAVLALAARAGLQEHWVDAHKRPRRVGVDTLRALLSAMGLACATLGDLKASEAALAGREAAVASGDLVVGRAGEVLALPAAAIGDCLMSREGSDEASPRTVRAEPRAAGAALQAPPRPGYYRLRLPGGETLRLAVAPGGAAGACRPPGIFRSRMWGLMAQVYSLRTSSPDPLSATWGHGDFATVRRLAQRLAQKGADVLALSPVHAMFSADPAACSPYCPSSRLFWNAAFAAPADMLGEAAVRTALAALSPTDWAALDGAELIDWPATAEARMRLLRRLHEQFQAGDDAARKDYQAFVHLHGQALTDHAVFESLHASHARLSGTPRPWPSWDLPWRDPRSAEVRDYAIGHEQDIDFHRFLQWLAAGSLDTAQRAAREAGMRIGLLGDLAVGASHFGSQAWSRPDHFLRGVSIGAPPDIHNPRGQVWRLTAFSPQALRQQHYEPFLGVLRAVLEHTGGLRIDHILGFQRVWVVPEGADAADGAYLHMPARELLALTALEAWQRGGLIIGENLGTVPEGFDAELRAHGIAGMNVLWFMRAPPPARQDAPAFLPVSRWPRDAVAMTTTHDLPTLAGWWRGTDIAQRREADLLGPDESFEALCAARAKDRAMLWRRLDQRGPPPPVAPLPKLLAHVASAPCGLMLASLEDLAGLLEAPNVPGTVDEFPNWRRRLPGDTVRALDTQPWRERLDAIRRGRKKA